MIKNTSELITFGYDSDNNIYSTPSSMSEYLQGFKAGTIINCRSMNTALKSTTCIINAMLEALGFKNSQTQTSLTLSDNDIVKNKGSEIENVNNITYSNLNALKDINNYKSVVKSLFFTLRQFRNINSNSADKIYCHTTNKLWKNALGNENTLAIYNNTYNTNNYRNHYNYADEVFMHKAGDESFNGDSLTLITTGSNLYTNITQSNVAYEITYNNVSDNRHFCYSVGGDRTNNFTSLYNTFDIGVHNKLGDYEPSYDNTLTNSVIIGCNNVLKCKDDYNVDFNNINLFGNNLTSSNTANNTTIIGHYNGTGSNHNNKVVIGCGISDTNRVDGLVFDGDGIYSSNGNIKIDVNNRQITLGTDVSDDQNAWKIESKGQITAPSFNATSDERLKENITPYKYHNSITDLEVKEFDLKNGNGHHIGCIAQDLQALYPELVHEDDKGYLSIEENKLAYLLLEEIKMLKKRVDELEKR
jgi:hypothetical protein